MWSITGDLRLLSVSEKHAISGEIFGKPSKFPRSEIFYCTLRVLLVLQTLPPRFPLQEAVARVDEVVVNLPAVHQLQHRQCEHVRDELEGDEDDGAGEDDEGDVKGCVVCMGCR